MPGTAERGIREPAAIAEDRSVFGLLARRIFIDLVATVLLALLAVTGVMTLVLLVAYLLSRTLQKQISLPILALTETARAVSERRDTVPQFAAVLSHNFAHWQVRHQEMMW